MAEVTPFTSNTEIAAIVQRLLDGTLPKVEWTHAAHFAAALWLLAERPVADVTREMPTIIRAYNTATGVANTETSGYHETITLASLRATRDHLDRHPGLPKFEAANVLLTSELGHPDWLLSYWSRPRLFAASARLRWCEPDIRGLPF